jgi:hypothetical protein
MFLKGDLHSVEYRLAKSVILINHTDLADVYTPEFVNLLPRLVVIRSPHIDDIALEWLVEHLRSSEQTHYGDLFLLRHGYVYLGSGRTHKKAKREHAFLGHALKTCRSLVGVVAVIESQQLHLTAKDSAFIVNKMKINGGSQHRLISQEARRTIERRTRSDQNTVFADAWRLRHSDREREQD